MNQERVLRREGGVCGRLKPRRMDFLAIDDPIGVKKPRMRMKESGGLRMRKVTKATTIMYRAVTNEKSAY